MDKKWVFDLFTIQPSVTFEQMAPGRVSATMQTLIHLCFLVFVRENEWSWNMLTVMCDQMYKHGRLFKQCSKDFKSKVIWIQIITLAHSLLCSFPQYIQICHPIDRKSSCSVHFFGQCSIYAHIYFYIWYISYLNGYTQDSVHHHLFSCLAFA